MKIITEPIQRALLMAMKTATYILIIQASICSMLLANNSNAQNLNEVKVTLTVEDATLDQALLALEDASGIRMVYSNSNVNGYSGINLSVEKESVNNTLEKLLENTLLTFEQVRENVVIKKKRMGFGILASKNKKSLTAVTLSEIQPYKIEAQTVTGTVTDKNGETMVGVTVLVKGTTIGTTTGVNGGYSLEIPDDNQSPVLVFSSIGMVTEEVSVGGRTTIDVSLADETTLLSEVVVTSFGVKQEKKSLGYAVQDVSGESLKESNQPNVVNTLQGKVAGVRITNSGGTPGASSSIVIRGGTSLDGSNQPLFVVDGIPVDNSTTAEPPGGSGQLARSVSNTNRGMDINPGDIESVTVLKGPAAAALYGIRAASGAIIITTKSGAAGESKITYSNSFEFHNANKLPELQKQYGMGTGGTEVASRFSWGPQIGGAQTFDNMDEFFKQGSIFEHNLSFTGGNSRSTHYVSASRLDQDGIVPGTDYDRTTFRLKGDTRLNDFIKVGSSISYTNTNSTKPLQGPGVLGGTGGFMVSILNWPLTDNMANFINEDGTRRTILDALVDQNAAIDNPYWTVRNNPVTDKTDRILGQINLTADPTDWLNITYRGGTDFYRQFFRSLRSPGTSLVGSENGGLYEYDQFYQLTTSNLLATFKYDPTPDLNVSLMLGNNVEVEKTHFTSIFATNFINPDFVSINNSSPADRQTSQSRTKRGIVSGFGSLNVNYKGVVYLNATGRNDWSSTLPEENRSFFYPSVGGSIVFSELLQSDPNGAFAFGKVRATWAKVGKDAPPHRLESTLQSSFGIGGGFAAGFFGNNLQLSPEETTSFEIGTDLRFLGGRVGLDVTYYETNSIDQIIQPRVSQGTGYIFQLVNGGTIENKGIELMLNGDVIQGDDFNWNLGVNWSKNEGIVKDLPEGLPVFVQSDAIVSSPGYLEGASYEGEPFLGLQGSVWETNDDGEFVIGADGYPILAAASEDLDANRAPDWIAGITNTLSFKNFTFSFLIDMRQGGDIFNGNEFELVRSGLSEKTINRGETHVFDGVLADGTRNTQSVVLDESYYQSIYINHTPHFVEDGSWTRLRYVSLTYRLPESALSSTPFSGLSFNVTGKNLLLITDYTGMDPEVSMGGAGVRGSGTTGIDYAGVPATKGVSFGLTATF